MYGRAGLRGDLLIFPEAQVFERDYLWGLSVVRKSFAGDLGVSISRIDARGHIDVVDDDGLDVDDVGLPSADRPKEMPEDWYGVASNKHGGKEIVLRQVVVGRPKPERHQLVGESRSSRSEHVGVLT